MKFAPTIGEVIACAVVAGGTLTVTTLPERQIVIVRGDYLFIESVP